MNLTIIVKRSPNRQLYRVKHDAELPAALRSRRKPRTLWQRILSIIWRPGLPEVFPLNGERTPFGEAWQHLSYDLNPGMSGTHWRSLYAYNRAFTNGTGFNGSEPKADFINRLDLTAPLPAWDKTRTCGGWTCMGEEDAPDLVVEILDGYSAPPSLTWLLAHPTLFFHAVNTTWNGITRFPQNDGRPCLVPAVGSGVARLPLAILQKVPAIADPYYLGYRPSPYV